MKAQVLYLSFILLIATAGCSQKDTEVSLPQIPTKQVVTYQKIGNTEISFPSEKVWKKDDGLSEMTPFEAENYIYKEVFLMDSPADELISFSHFIIKSEQKPDLEAGVNKSVQAMAQSLRAKVDTKQDRNVSDEFGWEAFQSQGLFIPENEGILPIQFHATMIQSDKKMYYFLALFNHTNEDRLKEFAEMLPHIKIKTP